MSEVYLWDSNGGCPRCDAMDGYHYDQEPTRPHPNCDCEITLVGTFRRGGCYEVEININNWVWGGSGAAGNLEPSDTVSVEFDFIISCWHGGGMSGTDSIDVSADEVFELDGGDILFDGDDWPIPHLDNTEEAMYARIKELAEEICDCSDPLVA